MSAVVVVASAAVAMLLAVAVPMLTAMLSVGAFSMGGVVSCH